MKKLTVIIERCDDNLSAYIDGLPIVVVGDNITEIRSNIVEAIDLYKEEVPQSVRFFSNEYELEYKFYIQSLVNYSALLREKRLELHITQEQLAQKIGKKRSYIARIESGKTDIQLSSLLSICGALGLRLSLSL